MCGPHPAPPARPPTLPRARPPTQPPQDNVPAFESETAVRIIETSLGAPLAQLYDEFDPQPIAAASLGQVHVAKVRGIGRCKRGW